ncbi:ribosome recycling factor family protein [Psychromonas aquatilis]|uniref:Ribosome recycling factor family protein n=1 Tax=Psychromonas aquatilis TaxID=2005072 RepID=A0ABU9GS45_9GAMM
MLNDTSTICSIKLNNFLHRIDCKTTMINIFTVNGCTIKRIRRSKNWLLTGKPEQLIEVNKHLRQHLAENIESKKVGWILEVIDKGLPKPSVDLVTLVRSTPDMTINRLIVETGCTLIEARIAIDKAEDLAE